LLLEGVAYDNLEEELYRRFGHVNPKTGKSYGLYACVAVLKNPFFWGHSAYGHRKYKDRRWLYDESVPVPDKVIMYWNTHEAVYQGLEAEQVKAEMRRRSGLFGQARPHTAYMFSGLLTCASCGATLVVSANYPSPKRKTIRVSYYCPTKYRHSGLVCGQTRHINAKKIKQYVHLLLLTRLEGEDWTPETPTSTERTAQLQAEVAGLEARISAMIQAQATATADSVRQIYAQKIEESGARLDILKRELRLAQQVRMDQQAAHLTRAQALVEIGPLLEQFWARPPYEIHQLLHRVFRHVRLVVREGEIIGLQRV
jgi:hypothetical protein